MKEWNRKEERKRRNCKICGIELRREGEEDDDFFGKTLHGIDEEFCPACLYWIDKTSVEELDEERKWTEKLFMQRFNNFLVVFSLIVTAGFATEEPKYSLSIFVFGFVFLLSYWLTGVLRAYHKYDTLLKIVLSKACLKGKNNPDYIVERIQERRKCYKHRLLLDRPVSIWLAKILPALCIVFLVILIIVTLCHRHQVADGIDFYNFKSL